MTEGSKQRGMKGGGTRHYNLDTRGDNTYFVGRGLYTVFQA